MLVLYQQSFSSENKNWTRPPGSPSTILPNASFPPPIRPTIFVIFIYVFVFETYRIRFYIRNERISE